MTAELRTAMRSKLTELESAHDEALMVHAGTALHAAITHQDLFFVRHAFTALQRVRNPTRYLHGALNAARTFGALSLRGSK